MLRGLEDEFEARTREVEAIRATFEEFTKYYAQSVRTWARRDLIRAVEALEANLKARIDKEGRARREKTPIGRHRTDPGAWKSPWCRAPEITCRSESGKNIRHGPSIVENIH